ERMYRAAIRLDPNFADAYFELMNSYLDIYWNGISANNEIYKVLSKNVLDTLLTLNIDKPIVHMANGYFKYHGERDYVGALKEFEEVGKKDPNNLEVLIAEAYIYRRIGNLDEAITLFHKASDLMPNDWPLITDI